MNEFLEQFLIEARELLVQAMSELSALKESSSDQQEVDGVFRAFHTLKGAAGIVEFDAMGRLMHHLEDELARARDGGEALSETLVDDCVSGLDLLDGWLEQIGRSGSLPEDADRDADRLILAKVARPKVAFNFASASADPATSWVEAVFGAGSQRATATVAIRYQPDPACFFDNLDPMALIASMPGLRALAIRPVEAWSGIEALDPFHCNLIIFALSNAPVDRVKSSLGKALSEIEIVELTRRSPVGGSQYGDIIAPLLDAQIKLLAVPTNEGRSGRIGAAGRVASNIERYLGNDERAAFMDRLTAAAILTGRPDSLIREMGAALAMYVRSDAAHDSVPGSRPPDQTVTSLRVDVRRIDAAVKLIGELGVVKNRLGHLSQIVADGSQGQSAATSLKELHAQLENLTTELQQSILSLRVLPLRHVFQRFPRLLREISMKLGKNVHLVTEGDATEADKVVVERLFDPLLHVIRNAVDHGIEAPPERIASGKNEIATIRLTGRRDGGVVVIELTDDGRGIDAEAIREAAAIRGLLFKEALEGMTREEVLQLIFLPGFSTAKEVTDLSGRGVGMDAVRSEIDRLGGSVDIRTELNVGTTIRFTLPYSIMMTRVLTVVANGQIFGLPFEAVLEMLQLPASSIAAMGAAQAVIWREQIVPLINLSRTLGRHGASEPKPESRVVLVRVGAHLGAIEVDGFGEPMDLMLTPREGLLAGLAGITGTTLLGDGRVLLVLDLEELFR